MPYSIIQWFLKESVEWTRIIVMVTIATIQKMVQTNLWMKCYSYICASQSWPFQVKGQSSSFLLMVINIICYPLLFFRWHISSFINILTIIFSSLVKYAKFSLQKLYRKFLNHSKYFTLYVEKFIFLSGLRWLHIFHLCYWSVFKSK